MDKRSKKNAPPYRDSLSLFVTESQPAMDGHSSKGNGDSQARITWPNRTRRAWAICGSSGGQLSWEWSAPLWICPTIRDSDVGRAPENGEGEKHGMLRDRLLFFIIVTHLRDKNKLQLRPNVPSPHIISNNYNLRDRRRRKQYGKQDCHHNRFWRKVWGNCTLS